MTRLVRGPISGQMRTQSDHPVHVLDRAPVHEQVLALGQALRVLPPDECEPIALRLFEIASQGARRAERTGAAGPVELVTDFFARGRVRHAEEAMRAILCAWDSVPGSLRPLIGGLARERWIRCAADAATDPEPRARAGVAGFAEDTADPGFASVLCALLKDPDASVRLGADRALLRLVLTLLTHLEPEEIGLDFAAAARRKRIPLPVEREVLELERVELCRRVADAAWSFADHRCRSPLIGSLLILDRVPGTVLERSVAERIRRLLKERHHPSHTPIRSVLRQTPSPLLRERALRWLVIDPIASTCVDRLSGADAPIEHEVLLRRAYLALRPSRAARLKGVRPVGGAGRSPLPDARTLCGLTDNARRGMVRLVPLIGLDEDARRRALEPTLADPDPIVRLAGAHAAHPGDLTDYAYDPDERVARSATLRWSTLGVPAPLHGTGSCEQHRTLAGVLERSPHGSVRALAGLERERVDPLGGTPASALAARRLLARDPVRFVRLVRERINAGQEPVAALMLIRTLRLESRFEMDLIDLATGHPEDRVRATAVAALGKIDSSDARRIVAASLHAPDARVRSNAIESVDPDPGVLLEYKNDTSHRVRASAVRRVLTLPGATPESGTKAGEALAGMLADERATHRLAGAWAAERSLTPGRRPLLGVSWRAAVRRVAEAAGSDPDPRVRARATRCARLLGLHQEQGVA